jgi:hypothetical protein
MFIRYETNGRIYEIRARKPSEGVYIESSTPVSSHNHYVQGGQILPIPEQPSLNHIFDYTIKQWVDPRSPSELKLSKWSEIKKERDNVETSGFTWNNLVFDSDARSQQRIQSAAQQAQLDNTSAFNWTLANNESVHLTSIQMLDLYRQLSEFIQSNFEKARVIRNQIELCNTAEELSNISW